MYDHSGAIVIKIFSERDIYKDALLNEIRMGAKAGTNSIGPITKQNGFIFTANTEKKKKIA